HLEILLAALADDPEALERPLPELSLLDPAERHQLLCEWSASPREPAGPELLHELFAAQAARTPDEPAVGCGGRWWTYRELDARAERLARRLSALGTGPESLVGICLTRSFELVAGVIAILKAGGAYL